jgi:hypothetical protein
MEFDSMAKDPEDKNKPLGLPILPYFAPSVEINARLP